MASCQNLLILRGCHQGDPISSYLFILVAQILSKLFLNNPNVKGISCGSNDIRLSQFADDTRLILGGTPQSLQAAFNVLEMFGSVSGLRVNTAKPQVVWIGKKKRCNEKLLKLNLKWDTIHFNMLGLSFSVDLLECTEINFSNQIVLFIYLGFYVAFNTVQVISRRVVGRAEETSTFSSSGFLYCKLPTNGK